MSDASAETVLSYRVATAEVADLADELIENLMGYGDNLLAPDDMAGLYQLRDAIGRRRTLHTTLSAD